ncbi:chitin disaccharide deacetylase [Providencia stuartii]
MTSLLIVNVDDFGLCKSVNYGILEAHRNGIVTSTTAMVNMPSIQHAAQLATEQPLLAVGMHFVLTMGKPCSPMPSLVRNGILGKWIWEMEKSDQLPIAEIVQELHCQYNQFIDIFGKPPSHIDSHHHVHMMASLYPLMVDFANQKGIALRVGYHNKIKNTQVRTTDAFSADFYGEPNSISESLFLEILHKAKQRGERSLEIMCHPAFIDNELLNSGYVYSRVKELDVLTSKNLKAAIAEKGFLLGSYLDLS